VRERPVPSLAFTLSALRLEFGCTQSQLAEALGITGSLLSQYENGKKDLKRERLEELLAPLGAGPEQIDLTLFYLDALRWETPEPLGSPFQLADEERRLIQRAAAASGRAAVAETLAGLTRDYRLAWEHQARSRAKVLWHRLRRLDPQKQHLLIEGTEEYRSFALCELVCEESVKAAADGVDRALDLAKLALFIAERALGSDAWRARLQGYAWAFMANARRVGSDLRGAERAFATAHQLWEVGAAADPGVLDASRLLDLEASLCRARRRWSEALELLDRALVLNRSPEATGRILLNKAFTHEQMGDCERAIAALEQAALLVDGRRNPRQPCVLRFNLGVNLCHLGRHAEAAALVAEAREIAVALRNDLDLLRVLWLEARVAAGLGRRAEAIAALRQVRADFSVRELPYDAALATLDLAILLLEECHNAEARALAEEMVAIFESLEVHREALAAVRIFQLAAEQEAATAELGRRLLRYLERARHDPELRFEAAAPERRGRRSPKRG